MLLLLLVLGAACPQQLVVQACARLLAAVGHTEMLPLLLLLLLQCGSQLESSLHTPERLTPLFCAPTRFPGADGAARHRVCHAAGNAGHPLPGGGAPRQG